jgi:hypothetical protein
MKPSKKSEQMENSNVLKLMTVGELKAILSNVPDTVTVWITDDTVNYNQVLHVTEVFFDPTDAPTENEPDERYFLLAHNPYAEAYMKDGKEN